MIARVIRQAALALILVVYPCKSFGQTGLQTIVGSVAELTEALAAGATTIALRPGSYREITINGHRKTSTVTFRASDPAQPPVVHKLTVVDSVNLSFENLRFAPHPEDGSDGLLVDIQRSGSIAFASVHFSMDAGPPERRWRGLSGVDVDGLVMRDSVLEGLERGLILQRGRQVTVSHNLFTRMGVSGINVVESSTVLVESNRFRGFRVQPGVTGTFVHVWTRGAAQPSRDLTVRNNVMVQDTATIAQGILLSNEARIPFGTVTVADNIVVVGSPLAISVDRADDVRLLGNIVLDTVDSTFNSSIRLSRTTTAEVTGNLAVAFGMVENRNVTLRRNTTISRLERRTRELFLQRLENGLSGKGDGRIHANHLVTAAQRMSGPRN
jgi:acetyltransferase-like isoleucine patch superfamily enzyme